MCSPLLCKGHLFDPSVRYRLVGLESHDLLGKDHLCVRQIKPSPGIRILAKNQLLGTHRLAIVGARGEQLCEQLNWLSGSF